MILSATGRCWRDLKRRECHGPVSVLKRSLGQQCRESTVEEHVLCGCVKCQTIFPLLGRAAPRRVAFSSKDGLSSLSLRII